MIAPDVLRPLTEWHNTERELLALAHDPNCFLMWDVINDLLRVGREAYAGILLLSRFS